MVLAIIAALGFVGAFYFFGQLKRAENEIGFLREEKKNSENSAQEKIDSLQEKILHFDKQNELLKAERQQIEKERENWEKDKKLMLSELLAKNSEQQNKIAENFLKNFENVAAKVSAFDDGMKKVDRIEAALLSPGGAGRTAEITLENILKSSNLSEKESLNAQGDYVLQSHFGSAALSEAKRPDAIVFLPCDQIMIIDSKSSPHFLELYEAQSEEEKKEILGKIKTTFRKHLEDLKRKDYAKFLFDELRSKNSSDYKILIVMFLQTEQMLEIVKKADKDFEQRAFEAGIVVATPVILVQLLSHAKFVIDRIKQEKNIELLKVEVRKLLDGLVSIINKSSEVGKAINRALSNYNDLTKSLNRAHKMSQNISELGIEGKKNSATKLLEEFEENVG
ncbi:MAG: hypothetical protein A2887_03300 [Alphaproteobacteria bacterium RIFCSPLOWO2_01_FULL_40_26]|nr:MAG: hypothetical protein A3D15_01400 [Alphaproteobacteria bacterium RIFCSPHIGHO2_02_FULL_40_34]OFW94514.1 MAG: hypothetical protein A2887_03300 [Alphaproteobacteria bacterium RIFCSPLOWO2_01_FULL_40_26]OFX10222.1 MAG: hypothetical protein A3H30_04225 [Alphaproteobacteria bacterium RIFCSPLOWO2_02_FULL_40_19]OFX11305.1 MAG: hypothetical protein A3G22_06180 [Alphaproteobacteria bacterium RIFCSPLOWO2_12_FULL_40_11]